MATRKRQSLNTTVVVQQTKPGASMRMSTGGVGGFTTIQRNVVQSYNAPPGSLAAKSKQAVNTVMAGKEKEKKDMTSLNLQLADYIEKRSYQDAQIKMLQEQIEALKKVKFPGWENLREEYKEELESLRDALKELKNGQAEYEAKIVGLQDQLESKDEELALLRKQKDELENRLKTLATNMGDLEGENQGLRRDLENVTNLMDQLKAENARLRDDINRLQGDLEHARMEQIRTSQDLEDERNRADFDAETFTKEIEMLLQQIEDLKRTQPEMKGHFESHFKQAVAELQKNYDENLAQRMLMMQSTYEDKIRVLQNNVRKPDATDSNILKSEVKTLKSKMGDTAGENNRLKLELEEWRRKYQDLSDDFDRERDELNRQISMLQARIAELEAELAENDSEVEVLMASKLDLEAEIAMYRKLLEGEQMSLRSVVERSGNVQSAGGAMMAEMILAGSGGGSSSQNSTISQSSGRVNLQKKCRGPLQLSEVRTDGQYVQIENTGTSTIEIANYTIKRTSSKGTTTFKFPAGTSIKGKSQFRVYGNAFESEAKEESRDIPYIVASRSEVNVWPTGDGSYFLSDDRDVEKASCIMTYSK